MLNPSEAPARVRVHKNGLRPLAMREHGWGSCHEAGQHPAAQVPDYADPRFEPLALRPVMKEVPVTALAPQLGYDSSEHIKQCSRFRIHVR